MFSVENCSDNQPIREASSYLDSKSTLGLLACIVSGVAGSVIVAMAIANVFGSTGFGISIASGCVLICISTGGLIGWQFLIAETLNKPTQILVV